MKEEKKGLCYRCEKRAKYLETGHGPRCECKQTDTAVHSCYCYAPVKPVILAVNDGDERPQFTGWMISARSHFVRIPEYKAAIKEYDDGNLIYWVPKEDEEESKD